MGLLDVLNSDEGRLGMGLLAAAGPRADGAGFGQRLQEGMGSVDQWKRQQAAQKMQEMQMQEMQSKLAQEKQMRELAARFGGGQGLAPIQGDKLLPPQFQSGILPSVGKPAGFDFEGYSNALAGIDPIKGLAMQQSLVKDNKPISVKADETLVDNRTFKPLFTAPKTLTKPAAIQEYEFAVSQGETKPFTQWVMDQKRAGATNVSTKIENKMGESIAGQVGPMVKDTYTAANGAVQQVDAANRIIKAVDSGKIISGPLAGGRMKIAQIGQILGVSGKDDAEVIARSRDVIRGLSEMTLQGRKQMTGQGAITESEGKLAEKANSGAIEDLTPSEIKQLANASSRAARFVYQQHQNNLSNMAGDPNTASLAKFYKPMPMPNGVDVSAAPSGVVNWGDLK